jgi:hypothetical protein
MGFLGRLREQHNRERFGRLLEQKAVRAEVSKYERRSPKSEKARGRKWLRRSPFDTSGRTVFCHEIA